MVLGSVREGRMGLRVARLVIDQATHINIKAKNIWMMGIIRFEVLLAPCCLMFITGPVADGARGPA